jgi:hypothetical protein
MCVALSGNDEHGLAVHAELELELEEAARCGGKSNLTSDI